MALFRGVVIEEVQFGRLKDKLGHFGFGGGGRQLHLAAGVALPLRSLG